MTSREGFHPLVLSCGDSSVHTQKKTPPKMPGPLPLKREGLLLVQ